MTNRRLPPAPASAADDDVRLSPGGAPTLTEIAAARLSRRAIMKGALASTALGTLAMPAGVGAEASEPGGFDFTEISHGVDETHHVAPDHEAQVLLRWGDPVLGEAPAFDPLRQSAAAQATQFGYNNDFLAYFPLPRGSGAADHGLLCVNHEYTNEEMMFAGKGGRDRWPFDDVSTKQVAVEMAAHGGSIVEIRRKGGGRWETVTDGPYNRRITASGTAKRLSGPAAGHARLRTGADPTGRAVMGTLNNCAGGTTPWGTWLMAEENIHYYFTSRTPGTRGRAPDPALDGHPEARNFARLGIPGRGMGWGRHDRRFDIDDEPFEANRFGWVVEVDPYDPSSTPIKRTALGRFKHEGAEVVLNGDGRIVVYSGDDQRFEYLYRFVSAGRHQPGHHGLDASLLDDGTLFVARFGETGTVNWMPLVHGEGPLTAANGFASQADILVETRRAADLLEATPLDRPEDIAADAGRGRVFVMLTNNNKRRITEVDAVNRRAKNLWGQIVELSVPGGDHAAPTARWEILVEAGGPYEVGAGWHHATTGNGWFACPDNAALDGAGRLWVATDQGRNWPKASGTADGLWALETQGPMRGTGRMFLRTPVGAELCGPCFTPDDETLFVAVQHPGVDGTKDYEPFGRRSTFDDPATRWPDFDPRIPPRPSVLAITRRGGGRIG